MSTDELDVDAIRARAEAATKGPWFREYGDVTLSALWPDPRDVADGYEDPRTARVVQRAPHRDQRAPQAIADADFIAHARTDIPDLLAEIERLTRVARREWDGHGAAIRRADRAEAALARVEALIRGWDLSGPPRSIPTATDHVMAHAAASVRAAIHERGDTEWQMRVLDRVMEARGKGLRLGTVLPRRKPWHP